MRVAVIGTGAAGLAAAWLLAPRHELTVYEAEARPGGHCHTIDVPDGRGGTLAVDTGFIVYNEPNYPDLTALLHYLGVATEPSDMSFAVGTADGTLEYGGSNLFTLFAQARNLARPAFHRMLRDILRFNRTAPVDLAGGRLAGLSLGAYLTARGYRQELQAWYLLPMGAAIWSSSVASMLDFPAAHFVRFFDNHGLLAIKDQPQWRTAAAAGAMSTASSPGSATRSASVPRRARCGATVRAWRCAMRRAPNSGSIMSCSRRMRIRRWRCLRTPTRRNGTPSAASATRTTTRSCTRT